MKSSFMLLQHLLLGLGAALLSEGQEFYLRLMQLLSLKHGEERHCWLFGLARSTPLPLAGLNTLPTA